MNNLVVKLESLNMDNDLSNLLSNLSINNNDSHTKFLDIKCVLYANHTTEGYILLVNNKNWRNEKYHSQNKVLKIHHPSILNFYLDTFLHNNFHY